MHMRFDSNEIHRRFLHTATLDDQRASPRTTAATAFEVVLQEICVAIRLLRRHNYPRLSTLSVLSALF